MFMKLLVSMWQPIFLFNFLSLVLSSFSLSDVHGVVDMLKKI